jgi:hypothetical protein
MKVAPIWGFFRSQEYGCSRRRKSTYREMTTAENRDAVNWGQSLTVDREGGLPGHDDWRGIGIERSSPPMAWLFQSIGMFIFRALSIVEIGLQTLKDGGLP